MKRLAKKLIREEKGQVFVLALVLLLTGGLIIAPLLNYVTSGLTVGQVHEERMDELYAADAGVEDALYQIKMNSAEVPLTKEAGPWQYSIPDMNGKTVTVDIEAAEDTIDFLSDIIGGPKNSPHSGWMVVEHFPGAGICEIEIEYNGVAEVKRVDSIGAWLQGDYEYVPWEEGEEPVDNITYEYPGYEKPIEGEEYKRGTAFIWEWKAEQRPEFHQGETKTLTFKFAPAEEPPLSMSWVLAGSDDIWLSYVGEIVTWKVVATATDDDTSKQTELTAYVTRSGDGTAENPYEVFVVAWEISLQQE